MAKSGKITPVIEPVAAKARPLERAALAVLKANVPLVMITNPKVGAFAGGPDVLQSKALAPLLQHAGLLPGYIVAAGTTGSEVSAFLKRYSKRPVSLVHVGNPAATAAASIAASVGAHTPGVTHILGKNLAVSYVVSLKGPAVWLHDRFNRVEKNASYPAKEFFSDDHLTFKQKKATGFGDFSIVGDLFSEKGGPAHAVAIHLHYVRPDGLWIRHFVSDRVTGTADTPGKFGEAVAKLDAFAAKNPSVAATVACAEFRNHHSNSHFPGLGMVKQLSIRHHIETLAAIL